MNVPVRIEQLTAVNPAAVDLARACSLAARIEPSLLRRLRLLIPRADASAEADLWFSDLLAGRDATAIALDPVVAEILRADMRDRKHAELREAAAAEIASGHADAHWSIRLEERIYYLDTAGQPCADERIDDLLLAALEQLRTELDPRGIARWLLGAAGRLPRTVVARTAGKASAAAAALHLDRQAPPEDLLDTGEIQAWLPWLAQSLPETSIGVQILDGAIILGAIGPDAQTLADVPATDPVMIEVQWTDGVRTVSKPVRFRQGEPVHVETGTQTASLITLTGATYEVAAVGASAPTGLSFDHRKVALRPCLGRPKELADLVRRLSSPVGPPWIGIAGRPGCGGSTVLVAVTDFLDAAVVEHFFSTSATPLDEPAIVFQSCLAQLEALYPNEFELMSIDPAAVSSLGWVLQTLADSGAFARRPLVVALDRLDLAIEAWSAFDQPPFPFDPPSGVRYLATARSWLEVGKYLGENQLQVVELLEYSDREVCAAMVNRDQAELRRSYLGRLDMLTEAADHVPGRLARIIEWIKRQPTASVNVDLIPASLTKVWPKVRAGFADRFGADQASVLCDILRAADGRHTWQDCVDAVRSAPDLDDDIWSRFWDSCRKANLVADTVPDDIVVLTEPGTAEDLLAVPRYGDRYLGARHDEPADFARTASVTRLAAAVSHALAVGDLSGAVRLCSELPVLRRRYAQDLAGLLADLDALGATRAPRQVSRSAPVEQALPDFITLRTTVASLAKENVPPAIFAAALHDRLAELNALGGIQFDRPAMPPLGVRRVFDEPELRSSTTTRYIPGPVLAISEGTADSRDNPVLITAQQAVHADGSPAGVSWFEVHGAVRGQRAHEFVAWSKSRLWTDDGDSWDIGRIDHAARLPTGTVVARPDGTITTVGGDWRMVGHGAPVTALLGGQPSGRPGRILAASEDGTVRSQPITGRLPTVHRGHRGAVRCLVETGHDTFVSGGDDGCLLQWRIDGPTYPIHRWQGQDAITCLSRSPDGEVLFGTASGRVESWHPNDGTSTLVGNHDGPVRGVVAASREVLLSWGNDVRFWGLVDADATGFPGGVRDVIVGQETYTVLCGDGSVQQRPLPSRTADHPERTCLAIEHTSVYIGLNDTLLQVSADGAARPVARSGPYVQATTVGGEFGLVGVRDVDGQIDLPVPESVRPHGFRRATLIAGQPDCPLVSSEGRLITRYSIASNLNQEGPVILLHSVNTPEVITTPEQITSLSVGQAAIIAGMASGDTFLSDGRLLAGDGQPVTAVAVLPDGAVLTGSSAGNMQYWPQDGNQTPTRLPRRHGPVTAMTVVDTWVLVGGADGFITLWFYDLPRRRLRLVHEVNLGAPVVALAAGPGLAAARDSHGRLWTFDLENKFVAVESDLLVTLTAEPDGSVLLTLATRRPLPYELTGIRVRVDDENVPIAPVGSWPTLEPDGTFTVPVQAVPDHPLVFNYLAPMPGGVLDITVDYAGPTVPRYRWQISTLHGRPRIRWLRPSAGEHNRPGAQETK